MSSEIDYLKKQEATKGNASPNSVIPEERLVRLLGEAQEAQDKRMRIQMNFFIAKWVYLGIFLVSVHLLLSDCSPSLNSFAKILFGGIALSVGIRIYLSGDTMK
jgi:hypothetical protein